MTSTYQEPFIPSSDGQGDKTRPSFFGVEFVCYLACSFIGGSIFLMLHRYVDACPLANTDPETAAYPLSRFLIKAEAEIPLARITLSERDLGRGSDALRDVISESLVQIIKNFNEHHNSSSPLFLRTENTEVAKVAYEQHQPWSAFAQRDSSVEMSKLRKSFQEEISSSIGSKLLTQALAYKRSPRRDGKSVDLETFLRNSSQINRALQLLDLPKLERAMQNGFVCGDLLKTNYSRTQWSILSRTCILQQFLLDDNDCRSSDIWFWTQPVGNHLEEYLTNGQRAGDARHVRKPLPLTDGASILNWATRLAAEDIQAKKNSSKASEVLVVIGVWRYDDDSQLRIRVSDFVTPSSWFSYLLATGRDCQPGRPFQGGGFKPQCASQDFHPSVVECRQNFNLLGRAEGIDTCVLPKSHSRLAMVIEITAGQESTGVQFAYVNDPRPYCSIDQDGKVRCLDVAE